MISEMAAPQPSSTIKQSGQPEVFPRPITTVSSNFGSHQLALDGRQFSQAMVQLSIPGSFGHYPLAFPNKQSMEVGLPSKKDLLPVSLHLDRQQFNCTSKFQSGMEQLPRIQNQAFVSVGTPSSLTSIKQQARMEYSLKQQTTLSMVAGSHKLSSINKRPAQAERPVKVLEDFESVRSKLRETLATALTACSKDEDKPKSLEKKCLGEEKTLLNQAEVPSMQNEANTPAADGSSCESLSNNLRSDKQVKDFDGSQALLSEVGSSGNVGDQNKDDIVCNVQEGHQQDHDIVLDDVAFSHSIMEDELLQGHGLCWASDFTSVDGDSVPHSLLKRPKLANVEENRDKDSIHQTSESLAAQIEAELFKLFGGVNKKYKEKGRSLLFNLKDPSNPELRERVLSGDVPPDRLCSMSAEELASKELSQWRQAKAEEFAQMVMLPDMNIDIRRLVRKTHKGEFQVEVEQDDVAHLEVALGSDVLSKTLAKANDRSRSNDTGQTSSKTHDISDELVQCENSNSDKRNVSSNLDHRFPEKTDYIQDFVVEEMKDTEILPPVVSLDEFMQALASEPPFENLEVNNLPGNTSSDSRNLDRSGSESIHTSNSREHNIDSTPDNSVSRLDILDSQLQSNHLYTKHTRGISPPNHGQEAYNYHNGDDNMKPETVYEKQVTSSSPNHSSIWEGFLQLNVSALSNVVSFFLSGEKTSMQGWPNILEVKGRVRLEAFEKFLQELPLSRSRAIMIVEFSWKENSMESGQIHLSEAIHSYITDERVGFAEPGSGIELYLCPPHSKVIDMLAKHLSTDLLENVSSVVNGLIGIVVWRKPHVIASPKASSHHHKHSSAKKHSSSKKHHERTNHSNPNRAPSTPRGKPIPQPDDTDDVPPGFGPPVVREIDDLPEFDFSRAKMPQHSAVVSGHSLPTSHMRELIQKYGHGGNNVRELGIPVQPWNDEDDIPEWKPSQNMTQIPQTPMPPVQMPGYPLNAPPFMMNQHHLIPSQQAMLLPNAQFLGTPLHTAVQTPVNAVQGQNVLQQPNAMWWPVSHGMPDGGVSLGGSIRPCHFGGQPSGVRPPVLGPRMVQGYGGANNGSSCWRPDNSGRHF